MVLNCRLQVYVMGRQTTTQDIAQNLYNTDGEKALFRDILSGAMHGCV